jgi:hypothetical protein
MLAYRRAYVQAEKAFMKEVTDRTEGEGVNIFVDHNDHFCVPEAMWHAHHTQTDSLCETAVAYLGGNNNDEP